MTTDPTDEQAAKPGGRWHSVCANCRQPCEEVAEHGFMRSSCCRTDFYFAPDDPTPPEQESGIVQDDETWKDYSADELRDAVRRVTASPPAPAGEFKLPEGECPECHKQAERDDCRLVTNRLCPWALQSALTTAQQQLREAGCVAAENVQRVTERALAAEAEATAATERASQYEEKALWVGAFLAAAVIRGPNGETTCRMCGAFTVDRSDYHDEHAGGCIIVDATRALQRPVRAE